MANDDTRSERAQQVKDAPRDSDGHIADRYCDEDGKDWFWKGSHTREQILREFCNEENNPPEITVVRARVELQPGECSDLDPCLWLDPDGPFEFWQVEGGEY